MSEKVFHRPGPLKQTNKAHKTGRHRSKGIIRKTLKGKSEGKVISRKFKRIQCKEQRRNQLKQLREVKRTKCLSLKCQSGGLSAPPLLVCVLPMNQKIDPKSALTILENSDKDAVLMRNRNGITYLSIPSLKCRFGFITPDIGTGNEVSILDYLKVCDVTLMLTSTMTGEDEVFDKWGHHMFNMASAQGIPTPMVALMDLESLNPKRRTTAKAMVQKFIGKLLPKEKIMKLDTESEGLNVIRRIGNQKKTIQLNSNNRPYMIGDCVDFTSYTDPTNDMGELRITGFLRGKPLSVNRLIHISGLGDFQLSQICVSKDPYKATYLRYGMIDAHSIVIRAEPEKQTPLQSENIPDSMDTEQTWHSEEEIQMANEYTKEMISKKKIREDVPEYQSVYIPDEKSFEINNVKEDNENNIENDDVDMISEFASCENESFDAESGKSISTTEEYMDADSVSETGAINDENYDLQMDFQEEQKTLQKIKEDRMDQMWPDEIDMPQNTIARTRFQKFRGLESFRSSPWHPNENLPSDYARIYKFRNFDHTKRRIIAEAKLPADVMPGWYITIHVCNVSATKWTSFLNARQNHVVALHGLLPHEHQMSVMNVVLKRIPDSEISIKSKDSLIIQCGYRRFMVNPIFSQHTNGDKHKFERYFRPHTTICATFYAPIQFPPAPVLAFKINPDTTLSLVARGCLLSCNPDRIILKRIVLTGHPMRINRKSATIRYMFFNKEDVEYFKPVKLRTKCGRLGHIKESLGTHGHMKCYFDGKLPSYDTVFMYLYKRVFPKWNYNNCLIMCENSPNCELNHTIQK